MAQQELFAAEASLPPTPGVPGWAADAILAQTLAGSLDGDELAWRGVMDRMEELGRADLAALADAESWLFSGGKRAALAGWLVYSEAGRERLEGLAKACVAKGFDIDPEMAGAYGLAGLLVVDDGTGAIRYPMRVRHWSLTHGFHTPRWGRVELLSEEEARESARCWEDCLDMGNLLREACGARSTGRIVCNIKSPVYACAHWVNEDDYDDDVRRHLARLAPAA